MILKELVTLREKETITKQFVQEKEGCSIRENERGGVYVCLCLSDRETV